MDKKTYQPGSQTFSPPSILLQQKTNDGAENENPLFAITKRQLISENDWKIIEASITPTGTQFTRSLLLQATLEPLESSSISKVSDLLSQCFFLRGHLFEIFQYACDLGTCTAFRVGISANCIWISPGAEEIISTIMIG